VTPVTVAVVNDYELVVAGVATMLRPYRDRLVVLDRALERTPDKVVDVSLFDTYGAADRQIDRIKVLADDPMSGTVVVFSFSTAPELVTASIGAGAGGFVSKTVNARQRHRGRRPPGRAHAGAPPPPRR
jgi:DNA-binding NarL/FixJ family response regulator